MTNKLRQLLIVVIVCCGTVRMAAADLPQAERPLAISERYIAIDNVCAWPNLTLLDDGTIIATIFNRPSHGRMEGDVECWASQEGRFWEKRGVAAPHDPAANRMNVAVGLGRSRELVVLAGGWSLHREDSGTFALDKVLPALSSHSVDAHTWTIRKQALPESETGLTPYIPYGDIFSAEDGSLRASAYAARPRPLLDRVSMLRSDDDGVTWKMQGMISDVHNETALFPVGKGRWLAAARRSKGPTTVDLFRSDDDGRTWQLSSQVTASAQQPADFLRLADGRLLLTCGNRVKGRYGVVGKISRDDGATWDEPFSLVNDLSSSDCGYPSSIQRLDGSVVTAYYAAGTAAHQRYHVGVVIWRAPAP